MKTAQTTGLGVLFVLAFAGSVFCSQILERIRPKATLREVLYVPSPKVIKALSLGFDTFLADIYWTRAVQYFGSNIAVQPIDYKLLYPLLKITVSLDPKLLPAYEVGSVFLTMRTPQSNGDPKQAVELLNRGIENNPQEWRLYRDLGFVYYSDLRDYKAAGMAFKEGSQIPGAHPLLITMAARTYGEGENFETSKALWQFVYDTVKDKTVHEVARLRIQALDSDEAVIKLEKVIQAYAQSNGRLPSSFRELVDAHYLKQIPMDPTGTPYVLEPDGSVEVQDFFSIPYITQGLPPGQRPAVE